MDRHEWGVMLGDKGTVEDDLRWTLFQSERCFAGLHEDDGVTKTCKDPELANIFRDSVRDAKTALAALWWRQEADRR